MKVAEVVLMFEFAIHRQKSSTCPAAHLSSSPFLTAAQPRPWTVTTS